MARLARLAVGCLSYELSIGQEFCVRHLAPKVSSPQSMRTTLTLFIHYDDENGLWTVIKLPRTNLVLIKKMCILVVILYFFVHGALYLSDIIEYSITKQMFNE